MAGAVNADMAGRLVVLTGASSGIGSAAAVQLARLGAEVVPVGRDRGRLEKVSKRIEAAGPGGTVKPVQADFASLANVRRLALELLERHERIDVLVNNAGVVMGRRESSEDGYEMTFAVNHLAPFLLTRLLLDRLRQSAPARVVTTSSDAHSSGLIDFEDPQIERSWSSWRAYSNSKLANILFTRALAARVPSEQVVANCLHPGVVRSRLGRNSRAPVKLGWAVARLFFRSPRQGASTIVHLASSAEGGRVSGAYFAKSRPAPLRGQAVDDGAAEWLWELSEELVEPFLAA
jgi:NAD(P)-dependent dehydrogenase (short-subunit alcohol dehydrogenase family)